MNFEDKVVVVTGAGAGIGKETAIQFAERGAKVIVATLSEQRGHQVANHIVKHTKGDAIFIQLDVSNNDSVLNMVQKTVDLFGGIDILVNNAGIYYEGDVVHTPEEAWDKVMAVNLKGAYLCSHHVVPIMLKNETGVIVNVSSEAGLVGMTGQTAYNVSKAGMISLTKSMAVDYAQKGIRVNAVCPGTTETPLVQNIIKNADDPGAVRRQMEMIRPLNRLGKPEEIAKAILVMSSEELGYATGAVLTVDGGYTA